MKRFLKKVAVFCGVMCAIFLLIAVVDVFIIGNQYTNAYSAAIIDKVERLQTITEPKIILVGDSNMSFGIDSALIEKELDMPVVNLGFHGGLGSAFHEELAKFGIREGDIVVVSHTSYDDDDIPDPVLLCTSLEKNWELWEVLRDKDWMVAVKAYPRYCINATINFALKKDKPNKDESYSREAFNQYGDIAFRPELKEDGQIFFDGATRVPGIGQNAIDRLNEFNEYVEDCGATMVVSYYPIAMGEFSPPESQYQQFAEKLEKELQCEIISSISDYFIPYEYFYDTVFHLNDSGVKIRTEQLINDLKAWLGE